MAAAGVAAGAAAGIVVDNNLQNQITGNQEVDDVLMRSVEDWLKAEDWHILFENRDLFMPINQALIPVETAGLFRADSTHNRDSNDWRNELSQKLTTRNELGNLRFNVDFGEGLWVEPKVVIS
ncbi:hypothetical protein ISN45_Aa03g024720 [Arabidopsis thaliana x Arabidopsis arenosa]|uniref:Uncharacterized protein n=1 Tax=Arabidopsis thaliana x Arabidopsis arenosa TaxID=1240361 RepID=A0A8T2B2J1_9BRAS|nr:hypothetical protein ISN45_Aa03g024720 [Arabidopsis thaliana x Arabidopsis arenosa]